MNDKDREEMQRGLAKLLGLRKYNKYPDGAMQVLLQDYPDDVETVNATGDLEDLKQPARGIYRAWEAGRGQESGSGYTVVSERIAEQLDHDAAKRSKVFSECLARIAAPEQPIIRQSSEGPIETYPEIKDFRVKYLGDNLLTPKHAWALLTSPVAAYWPRQEFDLQGIPIVGHRYQVEEDLHDEGGFYSLVRVPVPSQRNPWFKDRRRPKTGAWELLEKQADVRTNRKQRREFKTGYPPQEKLWKILPFPGADGHIHRTVVQPSSVLGALHTKVSRLIQHYPWEEPDATWFVLTGETPQVAPFTWQFHGYRKGGGEDSFGYGYVTLKIEPWIDPKLVWKVYTDIQRGLRGGRRIRRLGPRSFELLRFVDERVNVADLSHAERRNEAPKLVAAWDEENPNDSFEGNTKEFWKAYHRARRAIMSPSYGWRAESHLPPE